MGMMTRAKTVGVAILVGLPVLTGVLWLSSGHEVLTKSGKNVAVTVQDELFGGTEAELRFVRGPLLGYYVGLDAVGVVTAVAVASGAIWWWAARRRRPPEPLPEGGAHEP